MSSEVKHYWPEEIVGTGELVVYLADYAALAAELEQAREEIEGVHKSLDKLRGQCAGFSAYAEIDRLTAENARLSNSLLAITTRHFAESWKKRTSDAELEQYLSAGIAQLEAERDTLRQQLAERDAEIMEQCRLNGMGAERELKLIAQRDKLAVLLRKVLTTHKMWPDLALSLTLCADIEAALAEVK